MVRLIRRINDFCNSSALYRRAKYFLLDLFWNPNNARQRDLTRRFIKTTCSRREWRRLRRMEDDYKRRMKRFRAGLYGEPDPNRASCAPSSRLDSA